MSWQISFNGHSSSNEEESLKVNRLAKEFLAKLQTEGLNPTYGFTSGNFKALTWEDLNKIEEPV